MYRYITSMHPFMYRATYFRLMMDIYTEEPTLKSRSGVSVLVPTVPYMTVTPYDIFKILFMNSFVC